MVENHYKRPITWVETHSVEKRRKGEQEPEKGEERKRTKRRIMRIGHGPREVHHEWKPDFSLSLFSFSLSLR